PVRRTPVADASPPLPGLGDVRVRHRTGPWLRPPSPALAGAQRAARRPQRGRDGGARDHLDHRQPRHRREHPMVRERHVTDERLTERAAQNIHEAHSRMTKYGVRTMVSLAETRGYLDRLIAEAVEVRAAVIDHQENTR